MLLLKTWTVLLTFQQNLQTVDFISPNNDNRSALAVFMFFYKSQNSHFCAEKVVELHCDCID